MKEQTWNYRIVGNKKLGFAIHEVFYTNGKPNSWTKDEVSPYGETLEEFKKSASLYRRAFLEPPLFIKGNKLFPL